MEPKFRTSFVPKKPVDSTAQKTARRAPLGLLFIIALVLFLATVTLSIGAFLYQQFLEGSIARKGQELEQARATFEPALIRELTRLDARLETAETLLGRHTALTELFTFLENNTLESVQFRNFRYNVLPDGNITVSMDGRAASFSSVALQSDVFGRSEFIRSPIFENLNVDQRGDVVFNVTAFVDPRLLSYKTAIASRSLIPEEVLEEDMATTSDETTTEGIDSGVESLEEQTVETP